jgi:protein TonB
MKSLMLSIIILIATCFISFSQVTLDADSVHIIDTIFYPNVPDSKSVLNYQILPEFPGGDDSILAFAKRNLKYPRNLIKDNIDAKIFIRFSIDVYGIAGDVGFRSSVHPELEKECTELVNRLPKFKPGYLLIKSQKGRWYWRPTKTWYLLPVYFTTTNKNQGNIKLIITP